MNMDTAIFIARRIAAQSILLSEEAVEKLASILIRTELKKGALFLAKERFVRNSVMSIREWFASFTSRIRKS